jgi:hypothetical protein
VRPAAALALAALALTLVACGGGEEEAAGVSPLEVSGGGAAQFRAEGGDNSIPDFGAEAGSEELREAAEAVHGFFAALATEEWAAACPRLSRKVATSTERLAAAAPGFQGGDCAAALAALFGQVSAAEGREATALDAASLRHQGKQGFLIYRGAQGKAYFVRLAREDGRWVVDALSPTPLS